LPRASSSLEVGEAVANSGELKLTITARYRCIQQQAIFILEYDLYSGDNLIVIVSNLAADCIGLPCGREVDVALVSTEDVEDLSRGAEIIVGLGWSDRVVANCVHRK